MHNPGYGETDTNRSAEQCYSPAECAGIKKRRIEGKPDPKHITSYVERQNLFMRMGMRRFTRLTKAFSKKLENHLHMLSLYFVHNNFVRIHSTLHDMEWIVGLIDARASTPAKPGPKPGTGGRPRKPK